MERKDFKKITKENLRTCKEIILSKGDCMGIECENCLFCNENTNLNCGGNNRETLNLCMEALEKFGKKRKSNHITRNELKKFYTYLKQNYNIVGEKTNNLNSYESLENAISKIIDDIVRKALREQKERFLLRINES